MYYGANDNVTSAGHAVATTIAVNMLRNPNLYAHQMLPLMLLVIPRAFICIYIRRWFMGHSRQLMAWQLQFHGVLSSRNI